VLNIISRSLKFMTKKERATFVFLLIARASVSFLDLIGILSIGFLASSMALFLSAGGESGDQVQLGSISIPALTSQSLPWISGLILLLFISKAVFSILLTRQLAHFLARIEARAARVIAKSAFGRGIEGARQNSIEEILFAVQSGSPNAFNGLLNSVGTLVAEGFLFVLVISSFAFVDPGVALMAVIYFGSIGILIQLFIGRLMQSTSEKIAQTTVDANSGLSNLGDVIREVAILGRQDFFYDRIFYSRLKASGNTATQFVLSGMPRHIVETALIVAISAFIVYQTLSGDIVSSAATLGIFLTGGLRLTASLLPLQSALLTIKQAGPSANIALDFLELSDELNHTQSPKEKFRKPLDVSMKSLSFEFKGSTSETISDVSLEIESGSQAALIGTSGAGKSTLADLMLGLLQPTRGSVLVNGVNPSVLIRSNPGLMAYVPQKPGMISGTIAQNIALGVESNEIDMTKLNKAIVDAHLSQYVSALPDGINTDIGKRKDELSGGQLQRIGLARALYTEPKLLIMDEATSALDAESEHEINTALDVMRGKVTVILIAHRLNTIQRSDLVFLVDEGKIVAQGTFKHLINSNLKVQNLARLMEIQSQD